MVMTSLHLSLRAPALGSFTLGSYRPREHHLEAGILLDAGQMRAQLTLPISPRRGGLLRNSQLGDSLFETLTYLRTIDGRRAFEQVAVAFDDEVRTGLCRGALPDLQALVLLTAHLTNIYRRRRQDRCF